MEELLVGPFSERVKRDDAKGDASKLVLDLHSISFTGFTHTKVRFFKDL